MDKISRREAYVQRAERKADERTNLRAGQHILHLLLTVLTCGLWLPVWIIRSIRGNPRPYKDEAYRQPPPPPGPAA
jgi:hypothetical protein